jgi:hypothetical protein
MPISTTAAVSTDVPLPYTDPRHCDIRSALLRFAGTRGRPSLRGGSALPQPECGQYQAGERYQRADYLIGVAV